MHNEHKKSVESVDKRLSMQVEYRGFTNGTQESLARVLVGRVLDLLPPWCLYFKVVFRYTEDSSELASVSLNPEYQLMALYIRPGFFDEPEERQFLNLLHEIAHALDAEMIEFARRHIFPYITEKNAELGKSLEAQHREIVEAGTCWKAQVLHKLIMEKTQ